MKNHIQLALFVIHVIIYISFLQRVESAMYSHSWILYLLACVLYVVAFLLLITSIVFGSIYLYNEYKKDASKEN